MFKSKELFCHVPAILTRAHKGEINSSKFSIFLDGIYPTLSPAVYHPLTVVLQNRSRNYILIFFCLNANKITSYIFFLKFSMSSSNDICIN